MPFKIYGGNELINAQKLLEQGEIKTGFKVADLGCGTTGHFVFPAAEMVGEQGIVYAVDILKSVLQSIEGRAKLWGVTNVKTVWADLERFGATRIEDNSLDLALLINVLFQVKEKQTVIKEAARILKPGGVLIIADWKLVGSSPGGPPPLLRFDPQEARKLAENVGFQFIKEFEAGPYHYGLVFKKGI
jgi:ubiquinone/menaquinone biosynthesis C-methylase UbiE